MPTQADAPAQPEPQAPPPAAASADAPPVDTEVQQLLALREASWPRRFWGYTRLAGPGWLQSALTLGGGTLASALVAGTLMGYDLLWVQPLAMVCGIVMLSVLGYQTLVTDERPFEAVRRHVHPAMAWGWALASLLASIIWSLPQYNLSVSALADVIGRPIPGAWSLIPSAVLLGLALWVSFNYTSSKRGVRIYENIIKMLVGVIVVCFGLVVICAHVDWAAVLHGFFGISVPTPAGNFPAWDAQARRLADTATTHGIAAPDVMGQVGRQGFDTMLVAFATAVGINMTFLYPYSLRARGWGRAHLGLARFDLWTGMLIPFVICSSLLVIATASQLHGSFGLFELSPGGDGFIQQSPSAGDLAASLEPLLGVRLAHLVFGLGVLGMSFSTSVLLMLASGFVVQEIAGGEPGGFWQRLGLVLPGVGVIGPVVWGPLGFYLAVPTSVLCLFFLPIAYISFMVLHNSKAYLGEDRPTGLRRLGWNTAMGLAILVVTAGVVWKLYNILAT